MAGNHEKNKGVAEPTSKSLPGDDTRCRIRLQIAAERLPGYDPRQAVMRPLYKSHGGIQGRPDVVPMLWAVYSLKGQKSDASESGNAYLSYLWDSSALAQAVKRSSSHQKFEKYLLNGNMI